MGPYDIVNIQPFLTYEKGSFMCSHLRYSSSLNMWSQERYKPHPLLSNTFVCWAGLSCFSRVWFIVTLWTVARQAPLSMGFSRQGYWSGWPCPPPGDFPNLGIEAGSPALRADSLLSEPPGKAHTSCILFKKGSLSFHNQINYYLNLHHYSYKKFFRFFNMLLE